MLTLAHANRQTDRQINRYYNGKNFAIGNLANSLKGNYKAMIELHHELFINNERNREEV